jgi:hypothetical protein
MSPAYPEADTVVQANPAYTAPADLAIRLANTRQEGRTLELRYWDLKWRFEASPYEVRWPEQANLQKGVHECRDELNGRRSRLASLLVNFTDACNNMGAEINQHGIQRSAKKPLRLRMWKGLDKPFDEAKALFEDVEKVVLNLEQWHRCKTLDEERVRLQNRIERLNTFYDHILASWMAINIEVRETAKFDLEIMRLVIAAFEAPSSITPPFQKGMAQLQQDAPNLTNADTNTVSIRFIEGWINDLGEQAANIEAYLCKLRVAVHKYQLIDKTVLKATEAAKSSLESEEQVQGAEDLVQLAQKE